MPPHALGEALYGNFTPSTDPGLVSRMYPPETMARLAAVKRSGIRRTCSAAATTSKPRLTPARGPSAETGQCVSSASISVRSPDHSVWKVPSLSTRL